MEISSRLLKTFSGLTEHDLDGLIEFYRSHGVGLANKNAHFTWQELVQLYRTHPNISDRELLEMKGVSFMEPSFNELDSGIGSMESSGMIKNKKKSKVAGGKKKKELKNKTEKKDKSMAKIVPEVVKEKTEPMILEMKKEKPYNEKKELIEDNVESEAIRSLKESKELSTLREERQDSQTLKTRFSEERKNENFEEKMRVSDINKDAKIEEADFKESRRTFDEQSFIVQDNGKVSKNKRKKGPLSNQEQPEKLSKGKLSLLPNTTKGWEYYRKRSGKQKLYLKILNLWNSLRNRLTIFRSRPRKRTERNEQVELNRTACCHGTCGHE